MTRTRNDRRDAWALKHGRRDITISSVLILQIQVFDVHLHAGTKDLRDTNGIGRERLDQLPRSADSTYFVLFQAVLWTCFSIFKVLFML